MGNKRFMAVIVTIAVVFGVAGIANATRVHDLQIRQFETFSAQEEASRAAIENAGEGVMKEIYLAGGCFWGVEEYFSRVPGVLDVVSGYANGPTENPSYMAVCLGSGHAETVRVTYDPSIISLQTLAEQLFGIIDPTSVNRQGNDIGVQYRTGIYYTDEEDLPVLEAVFEQQASLYDEPLATELLPLQGFYMAEEKHQNYLVKNPAGYCHVEFCNLANIQTEPQKALATAIEAGIYDRPADELLREQLTPTEYDVTQNGATEPAFSGIYDQIFQPGIYVDAATGQPLFSSSDKFNSGCGWPAFSQPIADIAVTETTDTSLGITRIEVRSAGGDSHLGHVFEDGPAETGGLRYCINSAALRFIPYSEMESEGYGVYMPLCEE